MTPKHILITLANSEDPDEMQLKCDISLWSVMFIKVKPMLKNMKT